MFCIICQLSIIELLPLPENGCFCSKIEKLPKTNQKLLAPAPNLKCYIFILFRYTKYMFVCILFPFALQLFRIYIFSRLLRFFTFENFPFLTGLARTLKNTMSNKSWYFSTIASMEKSTALEF